MSGELEAAGAMATAGLAAGAIEGREAHGGAEGACLNCGAALNGAYCSQCGQAARAHRTLSHLFEEVLHGLFHFDTKAWRTLPMLVFRPGTLTRNYIYGRRARYISPLALFLFTIFFMFFVFAFVDADVARINATPQTREEIAAELTEARTALADARQELADAQAEPEDPYTPGLSERLAGQGVTLLEAEVQRLEERLAAADAAGEAGDQAPAPEAEGSGAGPSKTWQENVSEAARNGDINVDTPFPQFNQRVVHSLENPDLALYKIQQAAYKYSFLLVPISLPLIWLIFIWRRGVTLYDHAVFTLYSLAFASIMFVLLAVTASVFRLEWLSALLLGVGMPVHMFFHLKGAYALSWWSAIWRIWFLFLAAILSITTFLVTIILLGLAG